MCAHVSGVCGASVCECMYLMAMVLCVYIYSYVSGSYGAMCVYVSGGCGAMCVYC